MTARTIRLMADTRLSDSARVIGFWLLHEEVGDDGFVELRFDAIRAMLHGFPSDDVIRKHLRMLRGSGWAERKPGGFGKGDRYRMLDPLNQPPETARHAPEHTLLDPNLSTPYPTRPGPEHTLSPARPASTPSLGTDLGGDYRGGKVGRENASGSPPVVPPGPNPDGVVDEDAEALIGEHPEALTGCRDALRDYLARRIPAGNGRQRGYVATIITWVEGGYSDRMWARPDGTKVKPPARPGVLAEAINELLGSDEGGRKHPVGDPRNLKNKLTGLIRDSSRGTSAPPTRTPRDPKPKRESSLAANQGEHLIEEDHHAA